MELKKRIQVVTVVAFLCVSIDQITKLIAAEYLPRNMMRSYFFDTLRIGYTENIGAFLGLGNGLSDEIRFGIFVLVLYKGARINPQAIKIISIKIIHNILISITLII